MYYIGYSNVVVSCVLNILLSVILLMFTFNGSPLFRSILILINSLLVSVRVYSEVGFSWYFLLFVLVYVGGVYIVLIYVSMVFPNFGFSSVSYASYLFIFCLLVAASLVALCCDIKVNCISVVECSFYLCNSAEILVYVFLSMMLMIGLMFVNFIVSSNIVGLRVR
uniref:NADH dehydrogenase subunit 6 n=1 Tax=Schistosoma margrebowiei TaxID=48269 RepID=A0A1E1GJA5_9TREM|nr:NADH dehydrogenase subunit 6 [Schistosoma margrebowiei]